MNTVFTYTRKDDLECIQYVPIIRSRPVLGSFTLGVLLSLYHHMVHHKKCLFLSLDEHYKIIQ